MLKSIKLFLGCLTLMVFLSGGCRTVSVDTSSAGSAIPETDALAAESSGPSREPSYIVGTGDVFELKVLYHPEYDLSVTVPPDEMISIPRVHGFSVSGKTVRQIETDLAGHLSSVLEKPDVTVNLKVYSPQKILVLGKVEKPGLYPFERNLTIPQAIALAGGIQETGKVEDIVILPNAPKAKAFKVSFAPEMDGKVVFPPLHAGDIIIVPAKKIHKVDTFISQFFEKVNPALSFYLNMLDISYYKETYRVR